MKYVGIFCTILILGAVTLAVMQPRVAGASGGQYISHGEAVTLESHLPDEPDRLVLFQFTADWCGGCRVVEPHVAALCNTYEFVERKKIDIVSWESDAAQQMFEFFDARAIPYFALYNSSGDPLAMGDYQHIERTVMRFANR